MITNGLNVEIVGRGPRVVLIHGSVFAGGETWTRQLPLAERRQLCIVDRCGFGRSPPKGRIDFDTDAPLVAELLDDGAHLVGYSYGGVVALLAAAQRPEAVRSLAVLEPPAFQVAAGDPTVDAIVEELTELWSGGPRNPEAFLRDFLKLVGAPPLPVPVPDRLVRAAKRFRDERGPWEAKIPTTGLRGSPFEILVVSGGHHPAFDAVCDALAVQTSAQRVVVSGAGHAIPRVGAALNQRLQQFMDRAEGTQS